MSENRKTLRVPVVDFEFHNFELHEQLKTDCLVLGRLNNSLLLLMNNSLVPWFLIVPQTNKREIHEFTDSERAQLYSNINLISEFLEHQFQIDKINVASIGNVVNQMHVHVIGRRRDDYCWPDVVWGRTEKTEYKAPEVDVIVSKLRSELGDSFVTG